VCTGFWWGDLKERNRVEDLGTDWMIILEEIFKKKDGKAWIGLIWLRIVPGGGCL